MFLSKRSWSVVLVFAICVFSSWNVSPIAFGQTKDLFDGKSFEGWEGDTKTTWRIEDGCIRAGSDDQSAPRNEFLATTNQYDNFDLTAEYRLVGSEKLNAGIQFRSKRVPNHHEVSGYQADIGTDVDGHLYDETRRNRMLARPKPEDVKQANQPGDWNKLRIQANGPRIQIWLNDLLMIDYTEEDANIESTGFIALQIHGGLKGTISYRNIKVTPLKATRK